MKSLTVVKSLGRKKSRSSQQTRPRVLRFGFWKRNIDYCRVWFWNLRGGLDETTRGVGRLEGWNVFTFHPSNIPTFSLGPNRRQSCDPLLRDDGDHRLRASRNRFSPRAAPRQHPR